MASAFHQLLADETVRFRADPKVSQKRAVKGDDQADDEADKDGKQEDLDDVKAKVTNLDRSILQGFRADGSGWSNRGWRVGTEGESGRFEWCYFTVSAALAASAFRN